MKLALISDTHTHHFAVSKMFPSWLEGVDCVVHAGDATMGGRPGEIENFMQWMNALPVKHVVMIAGNHDFFFERNDVRKPEFAKLIGRVHYLQDSGVEIEELKFWGSPVQPEFGDWAFNRKSGDDIEKHWKMIPEGTDILVTHGPPIGYCDLVFDYQYVKDRHLGCPLLAKRVHQIVPKLHVFGHIHEGAGHLEGFGTVMVNASFVRNTLGCYVPTHSPTWVDTSDWKVSKPPRLER